MQERITAVGGTADKKAPRCRAIQGANRQRLSFAMKLQSRSLKSKHKGTWVYYHCWGDRRQGGPPVQGRPARSAGSGWCDATAAAPAPALACCTPPSTSAQSLRRDMQLHMAAVILPIGKGP